MGSATNLIFKVMIHERFNLKDSLSIIMGKGFRGEILVKANMKLELFDKEGSLKDVREIHNTVTAAGKNGSIDQILVSPTAWDGNGRHHIASSFYIRVQGSPHIENQKHKCCYNGW
jgi:hypothetical protein